MGRHGKKERNYGSNNITGLDENSILYRPYSFGTDFTDRKKECIGVVNKRTKERFYIFLEEADTRECIKCEDQFIDDLTENIIKSLDGILDFNLAEEDSKRGFIVFATIEGQPKYCFATNDDKQRVIFLKI